LKKCFILGLISLFFILCGCKTAKDIFLSSDGLRADAVVEYEGETYEMEIITGLSGTFCATVTKPLDRLIYKSMVDSVIITYKGQEWSGVKPVKKSMFTIISNVLANACNSSSPARPCGKGEYVLEGGSDWGDYILVLDISGRPLRLNVPSCGLVTVFVISE